MIKPSFASPASRKQAPVWIDAATLTALESASTTAFRLGTMPGAWVERYRDDLLLSYQDEGAAAVARAALVNWIEEHGRPGRRLFGKLIPRQNEERAAPILLEGDAALPLETVVEEDGVRYGLDFGAGYSAGLFLDQRANRALVRRGGAGRLLNTFAYTCSFSVVGALAGAETWSIDLSKKSLDRGRGNFELNGLNPAVHRFLTDDVLEALPRLARRDERFDMIILDPPTFSRGHKGRRFQVESDFEALLLAALEVANPRARLLLSTNCRRLGTHELEGIARFCLKASRRAATFHREPALPDIPAEAAASTLWLRLK